jgi:DNA-binding transcriptional MerR regulator
MPGAWLRIGEVAAAAGVSADTVRYYERRGLLPTAARTGAGYRQYSPGAIERVRLVRSAVQFGFSLDELSPFLTARDAGGTPCRGVRAAAEAMLDRAERQVAELIDARDYLRRTLRDWDQRLASIPPGTPARLLDTLRPATGGGRRTPRPSSGRR